MTVPSTIDAVPIAPDNLRDLQRAAKKLDAATSERNAALLKAHEDGASLREIAAVLEMNHVTVSNLIAKVKKERT